MNRWHSVIGLGFCCLSVWRIQTEPANLSSSVYANHFSWDSFCLTGAHERRECSANREFSKPRKCWATFGRRLSDRAQNFRLFVSRARLKSASAACMLLALSIELRKRRDSKFHDTLPPAILKNYFWERRTKRASKVFPRRLVEDAKLLLPSSAPSKSHSTRPMQYLLNKFAQESMSRTMAAAFLHCESSTIARANPA